MYNITHIYKIFIESLQQKRRKNLSTKQSSWFKLNNRGSLISSISILYETRHEQQTNQIWGGHDYDVAVT